MTSVQIVEEPFSIMPKISVMMPMFNSEKYIGIAIESILNQTFKDFELIILNDGSTDNSKKIAESYRDKRIRLIENAENQGLARTRNRLIAEAKGEFLAWLDSDDIALPQRLQIQVDFLAKNPNHALVASWARIIGSDNLPMGNFVKSYIPNTDLSALLLFVNYIVQSSVMLRRNMLPDEHYNLDFPPTEDYELWVRIAQKHPIAILKDILVDYRVHDANISFTQNECAMRTVKMNHQRQLQQLGISPTLEEIDLHYALSFGNGANNDKHFVKNAEAWLLKITEQNQTHKIYESESLNYVLGHRWTKICTTNSRLGLGVLRTYFKSKILNLTLQNSFIIGQYLTRVFFRV
jgi:glycosyltransferase involved in cell wall biosynthesis